MGLTPLTFSGISQYSQDFQTILERATNIASYPLKQLQNEQTDTATKKQLATELNSAVKLFGDKLKALSSVADKRAVTASSSNSAKLSVDSINTDTPTTYSITEVTSIATVASETSAAPAADSNATPISSTGTLKLKVGTSEYSISLESGKNNLSGIRDAINRLNAGVSASILTVGPNENYLTVSAVGTGQKAIQLIDDPDGAATNLLTSNNPGSDLQFKLNGIPVTRSTNQVNDTIPGVTFTVKDKTVSGETLTINLASDRSQLSQAVSSFIDAYNALESKVGSQIGENAGLLSGDLLVREAKGILQRAAAFGLGGGSVKNWSDLGVTFNQTGEVSFDTTKFNSLSDGQIRDAFSFFQSKDGLGAQIDRVNTYTDDINGLAKLQLDQYQRTDLRLSSQISTLQDRIDTLRKGFLSRLQAADALLGQLESQQKVVSAQVQSLNLVLYGKSNSQ